MSESQIDGNPASAENRPYITRRELAALPAEGWARWLRSGVLAFHRGATEQDRLRALAPLTIHPTERYPAAKLAQEIVTLTKEQTRVPGKACEIVLEAWSFAHDAWQEALFILDVANRLGSLGLFSCCIDLLRKSDSLLPDAAETFTSSMIMTATRRFTAEQVVALGQEIGANELWTPSLLADYTALFGQRELADLPRVILEVVPGIKEGPHDGDFSRPLALRLAVNFDRADLKMALKAVRGEEPIVASFRQTLAEELCFQPEGGPEFHFAVGDPPRKGGKVIDFNRYRSTDTASEGFSHAFPKVVSQ